MGVPLPDVAKIESRHTDTGMVLGVVGIAMLAGFAIVPEPRAGSWESERIRETGDGRPEKL